VAGVKAKGVFAHDDVGVGPALREEAIQPLGDRAAADMEHRLGGVPLIEEVTRQQRVVEGNDVPGG
jgi:hypothetical protein